MKWLRNAVGLILLIPSVAFASEISLQEIGSLIVSGRGIEARDQLIKARDAFIAEKKPSQEAATWLLLGMVEMQLSNENNARSHLRQAADQFSALGDHFGAWLSLWSMAMLETSEGATTEAIAAYGHVFEKLREASAPEARFSPESAEVLGVVFGANTEMLGPLAQYPEVMKPFLLKLAQTISHDSYSVVLLDTGDLDGAEKELRQASEAAQLFGGLFDGTIALHYAQLRQQQWRFDEAREYYMKALANARTIGKVFTPPAAGSDPWIELGVLRNLAQLELLSGRLDDALAWNDRALELIREKGDPKREAHILLNRADLMEKGGRYDQVLALYEDALKFAIQEDDPHLSALAHGNLGAAHIFRGSYGTAASHLEKSIALYQMLGEPYIEASTWILLAEVYALLEADHSADSALENARKLADKSDFRLARALVDVVTASRKGLKRRGNSMEIVVALDAFFKIPEVKGLMFSPGLEQLLRESSMAAVGLPAKTVTVGQASPAFLGVLAHILKGSSAMERGEYKEGRDHYRHALALNPNREHKGALFGAIGTSYWIEGNRGDAIRHFRLAADAFESSAADLKVEELLSSYLGSNRRWYFDLLIEMLVIDKQPMEAFAHAERARARAFLQMVGNHRFNAATSADPQLVAEAENVRAAIADREKQLMSAQPEEAARIAADLVRAREHYRAVVIRMKTTNPEYEDLTNVSPRQISTVRDDLPPGTTLISYYVTLNAVHAWVIDRETTHYELLHLDKTALEPITCWADELGSRDTRGVKTPDTACNNAASAADAYRVLIAPLRKHIRNQKLLLVPHGALHYIPFAALRDPESGRYLVQDFTLTYAPSASTLRFLRAKETPVDGGALVLGDPVSSTPGFEALPGAKQEATFVARMLGTTPRLGNEAREALLYGLNGKFDLVHIAAHATYDPSNPLFSKIALAAGDKHDGNLTVTEILSTIDLKGVNLVVLSACRSAVGQRSGGDEIVGLTRALLYAGTPGVISTLWNVNDMAAAGLMNHFYRRLGEGASAAEALRHAQLALIESETNEHPKFWAAFMLTGDPQGRWKTEAN